MDIHVEKKGSYRLTEGNQTIVLDTPSALSLLQTVLDDEYEDLDLNIDEILLQRQEDFEIEKRKYIELPIGPVVLSAFELKMKVFSNFSEPIYQRYEEIDINKYFERVDQGFYRFFCLEKEEKLLLS